MKTLKNIRTELADQVFEMTGFDYDIRETENNDGTCNIEFDSPADAEKFKTLLKEF